MTCALLGNIAGRMALKLQDSFHAVGAGDSMGKEIPRRDRIAHVHHATRRTMMAASQQNMASVFDAHSAMERFRVAESET